MLFNFFFLKMLLEHAFCFSVANSGRLGMNGLNAVRHALMEPELGIELVKLLQKANVALEIL